MPIVQFLFPEASVIGGATVANSVSLAVTTVVGLGVFDSVAGQSQISERAPLVVSREDSGGHITHRSECDQRSRHGLCPAHFQFQLGPR